MTDQTSRPTERRPVAESDHEHARLPRQRTRTPHEPDRIPVRAGRFLELLDRSRRG